jgi:Zn-dependent protease
MERRWKIASIAGIPIHVTVPWLAFAALVVWGTYQSLLAAPLLTQREALGWALGNAALFYGSIVVHELAHAFTARAFHVPVHGITLVFWGGYTETNAAERGPLASFLISAAGPFSTLMLAGAFWLGSRASDGVPSELLGNLAFLSVLFAGLNALPGFPVDGGRMLLAAVWGVTRDRFVGMTVAGWGGVAVGVALGLLALDRIEDPGGDWIFFAFIGWMMIAQGMQVVRQVPVLRKLATGTAAQAMGSPLEPIGPDRTLVDALETHLRREPSAEFPVVGADGRLVGALSFDSAAKVGRRDPMRPVSDAMLPRERIRTVRPDDTLDRALETIAGQRGRIVVVDGADRVVGSLRAEDVDRWYRRALGGEPTPSGDPRAAGAGPIPPRPDLPGGGVGDEG